MVTLWLSLSDDAQYDKLCLVNDLSFSTICHQDELSGAYNKCSLTCRSSALNRSFKSLTNEPTGSDGDEWHGYTSEP